MFWQVETLTREMCELETKFSRSQALSDQGLSQDIARLSAELRAERERSGRLQREVDAHAAQTAEWAAQRSQLSAESEALKGGEMVVVESMAAELRKASADNASLREQAAEAMQSYQRAVEAMERSAASHSEAQAGWAAERVSQLLHLPACQPACRRPAAPLLAMAASTHAATAGRL